MRTVVAVRARPDVAYEEIHVAAEDLQLDRITSLSKALDRVPQGKAAFELARRLGLVSTDHDFPEGREAFPTTLSEHSNDQISDLHAYWLSESGRILELVGQLQGQKKLVDLQMKSAVASARSRARRNWPDDAKKPTQGELNDRAEEDTDVIDLLDKSAYIELLLAHAKAALDATNKYLDGINREVILRTSQMKARILS
jgi:hypothetical protein